MSKFASKIDRTGAKPQEDKRETVNATWGEIATYMKEMGSNFWEPLDGLRVKSGKNKGAIRNIYVAKTKVRYNLGEATVLTRNSTISVISTSCFGI